MANASKQIWITVALVATGALLLILAKQYQPKPAEPVTMQEVFTQTPAAPKEDPIAAPAIVTTPVNGVETAFSIQVYSFMDKSRAEKALEALKQEGYKAFMEVSDLGAKGTFYRVRIGDIANEVQAKKLLEDIRKNFKSGFIIKPKKAGTTL